MTEQLVIAPLKNGVVADGPLHEPAESKRSRASETRVGRRVYLAERIAANNGIPPYDWPAKCGVFGIVYIRDGVFAGREMCAECAVAVPPKVIELKPCGTDAAYQRGCRCEPCTDAHNEYHRAYRERVA